VERTNVYLSAVFGRIEPAEIVEFMKEQCLNGVNLQLQMHKFIWRPDMKGV
jgi:7-carboxy-7-deazaguanine synthase